MTWDGIERRRFVRVKLSVKTDISPDKETMISTCAEDISEGGLKVTVGEELEKGAIVDLEIYLRQDPIRCKGKVVRVNKIESSYLKHGVVFDIGIEFHEMTEDDKSAIKGLISNIKRQQ